MSNEEYWSIECKLAKCGKKIYVEKWVRDAIVNFQTSPETADVPKNVEGEDLQEKFNCPHCQGFCVFDPEHPRDQEDYQLVDDYKEEFVWFITPEDWTQEIFEEKQVVWGNRITTDEESSDIAIMHIPKNCSREELMKGYYIYTPEFDGKEDEITDVEEKSEMKKEQSMSEPTVDEVLARWTIGHKLYFLQFALAGIDENRVTNDEMQTIMRRMKTNKAMQEKLGKDGYHDEEQRFKDAEIIYNQAEKEGNLIRQSAVFISAVAERYEWNEQVLTLLYGEMFEVVMADREIWHGERHILQMMVDEWGIMAGPFLQGMTDASGISFPP